MRILHITEYCHAGSVGGTERYILDLIRGLDAAGFQNTIGWLKPGHSTEILESEGVRIVTLPSPPMRVDDQVPEFHQAVEQLLEKEKPDLLHFHTFSLTEAALSKKARQRGIPYVFTYHSPAWTCRRGDLLVWGKTPCDGEVRTMRCSACKVHERFGGARALGYAGAMLSIPLGWLASALRNKNMRRRICFVSDSRRYRAALREFLKHCALTVSCSDWGRPVLLANGANQSHLTVLPQGIPNIFVKAASQPKDALAPSTNPFIVGYVGRMTPVKGVDILIEGFSLARAPHARLRIFGWENRADSDPFARKLQTLAESDSRIELRPKLSLEAMVQEYKELNLVAIPSVWMETGPLVLLEALALGIPVYGSSRIGQIHLLKQYGKVVEPNTAGAWRTAIEDAVEKHRSGQWQSLVPENTSDVMTMRDVAGCMAKHYKRL